MRITGSLAMIIERSLVELAGAHWAPVHRAYAYSTTKSHAINEVHQFTPLTEVSFCRFLPVVGTDEVTNYRLGTHPSTLMTFTRPAARHGT
jgi:hypothetical protein